MYNSGYTVIGNISLSCQGRKGLSFGASWAGYDFIPWSAGMKESDLMEVHTIRWGIKSVNAHFIPREGNKH